MDGAYHLRRHVWRANSRFLAPCSLRDLCCTFGCSAVGCEDMWLPSAALKVGTKSEESAHEEGKTLGDERRNEEMEVKRERKKKEPNKKKLRKEEADVEAEKTGVEK